MSHRPRWRAGMWKVLRIAFGAYLGIFVLLAVLQRKLIFLATKADEATVLASAEREKLVPWRNSAGDIIGWRAPEANLPRANRLLVFHGNAGYAVMRNHFRIGFQRLDNGRLWDVVIFEYPGYGARQGDPSEETIDAAARAALEQLTVEDDRPIYVVGESLGSGPASYLAGKFPNQVSGLLLITPFTSLPDVASYHYPFLPVRLIMRDSFDNIVALEKYGGPLAMLLADRDRTVPVRFGRRLFESYGGPKMVETFEDADHDSINFSPNAGWWRSVSEFLLETP